MSSHELITDDYVAGVLAREAADCALKYSTMGMEAYSTSQPVNKPKPNTRFLQNVLKGTKYHNDTLLAKAEHESQAKLQELSGSDNERRRRPAPSIRETRGRQLEDIAAILGGGQGVKRKRDGANKTPVTTAEGNEDQVAGDDRKAARDVERQDKEGKRRRSLERFSDRRARREGRDEDKRDANRRKRRSPDRSHDRDRRREKERKAQARSEREKVRLVQRPMSGNNPSRQTANTSSPESTPQTLQQEDEGDMDADEDSIGPAPPSARQAEDKWDDAVQAYRDRAKKKQQGADNSRETSSSHAPIHARDASGKDKSIDDVKWSKAGEEREWDRGKVEESAAT